MNFYIKFVILLSASTLVNSWDTEQLEIFDLVQEINQNFYELMKISQNATGQEIKRAFRGLSIQLHPDKSDAEDANIQFRNLVSVYEVLKDASKREKYDKVLKEGLPNWKSALFYYRRMRKIGLIEGAGILFLIFTIGQYFFAWAAYLEKKYTAEEVVGSRLKKLQKKNKTMVDMNSILDSQIPKPSIKNTLPFQIPLFFWNLPSTMKSAVRHAKEFSEAAMEKRQREIEEAKQQKEMEEELVREKEERKLKKENLRKRRQAHKAPEKTEEELEGYSKLKTRNSSDETASVRPVTQKTTGISGGFWTDDDLAELVRLVKKYPGGTSSRWETIAEMMHRSAQEITFMAAKLKENGYKVPGHGESVAQNIIQEAAVKKDKVKKAAIVVAETNWSQEQQAALEVALTKYRKTANTDRWQKIGNSVPGKTKEECLMRYKYLCDIVKQQKAQKTAEKVVEEPSKVEEVVPKEEEEVVPQNEEDEEEEDIEEQTKGKRKNKRKERRRRRDLSSDEDSDDMYTYD